MARFYVHLLKMEVLVFEAYGIEDIWAIIIINHGKKQGV